MPLMKAPLGKVVTISECHMQGNIKHHMDNLGVLPGEKIIPMIKSAGNIIIKVRDSRLALNREIASQIIVQ